MYSIENLSGQLKKSVSKYANVCLLFASVFLYHTLFIFQGFDVTDMGYHLTNQVNSFTLHPEMDMINPFYFFTDFIGGLWLSIPGSPNLLWARFGGVLLISLNAAIIYSILTTYFEKEKVFPVVFISTLFITMHFPPYIHYFTFPAFMINIGLWLLNKSINAPKNTPTHRSYSFLLGLILIPTMLSRVTLLLILSIPIFISIYKNYTKNSAQFPEINIPSTSAGFFVSCIIFILFYWKMGIMDYSITYISEAILSSASANTNHVSESHTMTSLISSYIRDYRNIAIGTIVILVGLYILSTIKERIPLPWFNTSMIIATFAGIIALILSGLSIDFFAINLLKVSIGIICILCTMYLINANEINPKVELLIIVGFLLMIINPIGSDCGVLKAAYAMWLILPLSILSISSIQTEIQNQRCRSMVSLMAIALAVVLILSIFFQVTNIYRDDNNRLTLTTNFSDASLKGIYSTNDHTKIVDETIIKIKEYSNPNDKILMVNSIPMFYYLTETKQTHGNPWLFLEPLEEIEKRQTQVEQDVLPELFVYSKTNTRDRNWPNNKTKIRETDAEKLNYLVDRYTNVLDYKVICENEAFVIMKKTE